MNANPQQRLPIGCIAALAFPVVLLFIAGGIGVVGYRMSVRNEAPRGHFGSPQRGRALLSAYGCPACHPTPGLPQVGIVGPPLSHIGSRSYIAGRFPNERIDMELWLQYPQKMKPGTAMPDLGVSERDARDIATYLATLK